MGVRLDLEELKELVIDGLERKGVIVEKDSLDFIVSLEGTPCTKPRYVVKGCSYKEAENKQN